MPLIERQAIFISAGAKVKGKANFDRRLAMHMTRDTILKLRR